MDKNEMRPNRPGGRPMGGPRGPRGAEKAKDFSGTWKKLLGYIKSYHVIIVIALIFSIAGTVLTLAGPDKLSDMTNTISAGIIPDTEKLQQITEQMSENVSGNMETVMGSTTASFSDEAAMTEKMMEIMHSADVSDEDKLIFQQTMSGMGEAADMTQMLQLPDSILKILFSDVQVSGVTLTWEDQVKTMELMSALEAADEADASAIMDIMQQLPENVLNALYTDITIDGVSVTGADQRTMMELFSEMDMENMEATEDALAAMDELPASVYSLIEPSIDMEEVLRIGMLLVAFYVASLLLSAAQSWIMATITQRVSKSMRFPGRSTGSPFGSTTEPPPVTY